MWDIECASSHINNAQSYKENRMCTNNSRLKCLRVAREREYFNKFEKSCGVYRKKFVTSQRKRIFAKSKIYVDCF